MVKNSNVFHKFLDYMQETSTLLSLCMRGIHGISIKVPLLEAVSKLERASNPAFNVEEDEELLKMSRREAELAQNEIEKGFPLLHAHSVVGAWGALESTIIDFLVTWLSKHPEALKSEQLSKVKISLAEFENLEKGERMRILVYEFERSLHSTYKAGVSRFEAILAAVGLGGAVEDEVKKNLYEMFHIRNVIVHRASIADRRFIEACPWMGYSSGDSIKVTHADWLRYSTSLLKYATTVANRAVAYTPPPDE